MRLRSLVLPLVPLAVVLLSGCLTTEVSLDYMPNPGRNRAGPPVLSAGVFQDERGEDEPRLLGTVKTPIGTPFERVYLRVPADEAVHNAFLHALDARGMLAPASSARFSLEGDIKELECELLVRPYASAKVRVDLVDRSSGRVLYRHTYEAHHQNPNYIPGSGDPVPGLRDLTSRVLQDIVDRAIDDPHVREWIDGPVEGKAGSLVRPLPKPGPYGQ